MDNKDLGRLADAIGLSSAAPIEPVPVSPVPASIPSATIGYREDMIERLIASCEAAPETVQAEVINAVALAISDKYWVVEALLKAGAFVDAALAMLPAGGSWRRYTDGGCSVYAASPYNAAAQVRYDGHTEVASLSLCAAILRMVKAKAAKAQAIEARRAETSGSARESAVRQDAPNTDNPNPIGDNQ